MKKRQMVFIFAGAMIAGAIGGGLLSPTAVSAAAKEIIELLDRTDKIQQTQKDTTTALTTNFAVLKTLIEQQSDSNNKLGVALAGVQKSVQDMQANSGAQLNSTSTQVSGITDNLADMQQRLSKLNTQLADIQGTLQSLDAKVSALSQPAASVNPGTRHSSRRRISPHDSRWILRILRQPASAPAASAPSARSSLQQRAA